MAESQQFVAPKDTIVAQSTAAGAAAIAIVRLSGAQAFAIGAALAHEPVQAAYRLLRCSLLQADNEVIDEAMWAAMPGPNSYTGEDLLELHLHGSPAVVRAVLARCVQLGARLAEPGEFTRRAFVHNRLDLAQAEAVGALLHAESDAQRRLALGLLQGGLSRALQPSLDALEGLVAQWRAALDFPDDAADAWQADDAAAQLQQLQEGLQDLLSERVDVFAPQPQIALVGPSNAGKSTLMNAWLGQERALVDAQAGTTRDAISAAFRHLGTQLTLWDTAGLRSDAGALERRGMAQTRKVAEDAGLLLWLTGFPAQWPQADALPQRPLWVVGSHADQYDSEARAALQAQAQIRSLHFAGWLSVPQNEGVAALASAVAEYFTAQLHERQAQHGMTQRQQGAIAEAHAALAATAEALAAGWPSDCVLSDAERALAALGHVLGRDVDAAVLDRIFADFCIGK